MRCARGAARGGARGAAGARGGALGLPVVRHAAVGVVCAVRPGHVAVHEVRLWCGTWWCACGMAVRGVQPQHGQQQPADVCAAAGSGRLPCLLAFAVCMSYAKGARLVRGEGLPGHLVKAAEADPGACVLQEMMSSSRDQKRTVGGDVGVDAIEPSPEKQLAGENVLVVILLVCTSEKLASCRRTMLRVMLVIWGSWDLLSRSRR